MTNFEKESFETTEGNRSTTTRQVDPSVCIMQATNKLADNTSTTVDIRNASTSNNFGGTQQELRADGMLSANGGLLCGVQAKHEEQPTNSLVVPSRLQHIMSHHPVVVDLSSTPLGNKTIRKASITKEDTGTIILIVIIEGDDQQHDRRHYIPIKRKKIIRLPSGCIIIKAIEVLDSHDCDNEEIIQYVAIMKLPKELATDYLRNINNDIQNPYRDLSNCLEVFQDDRFLYAVFPTPVVRNQATGYLQYANISNT